MEVASKLCVDEVVDHGIDQGGGHGQQVDTQVHILYPGKVCNFYKIKMGERVLEEYVKTKHMTEKKC